MKHVGSPISSKSLDLSPEIHKRTGYNHSADYWSMGITIYEIWYHNRIQRDKNGDFQFPNGLKISSEFQSLIMDLLRLDMYQRLGSGPDGPKNIKNHPFFLSINWDVVEMRQLVPQFIPSKRHLIGDPVVIPPEIGTGAGSFSIGYRKQFHEYQYYESYEKEELVSETSQDMIIRSNNYDDIGFPLGKSGSSSDINSIPSVAVRKATSPRRASSPGVSVRAVKSTRSSFTYGLPADSFVAVRSHNGSSYGGLHQTLDSMSIARSKESVVSSAKQTESIREDNSVMSSPATTRKKKRGMVHPINLEVLSSEIEEIGFLDSVDDDSLHKRNEIIGPESSTDHSLK
jgi:hypothetical protein